MSGSRINNNDAKKKFYVCNCDCRMTETEKHQYEVNHGSEFLSGSISVFSPEALRGGREERWLPNGDGLERAAACGRDLGNAHSWHRGDKARGGEGPSPPGGCSHQQV